MSCLVLEALLAEILAARAARAVPSQPGLATAPTFSFDSTLPKLPIPPLNATLSRLKRSIEALPQVDDAALKELDANIAASLPTLEAAQQILLSRQKVTVSYIEDWWDKFAYLATRDPNVFVSNVFSVRDSDFDQKSGAVQPPLRDPIQRAAMLILENLAFRSLIAAERLPPEVSPKGTPICMHQYRRYFSVRIPGNGSDTLQVNAPDQLEFAHIMFKGSSFLVPLKTTDDEGKRHGAVERYFTHDEFAEMIRYGVERIAQQPESSNRCVGALTAADRETWATAWKELVAASPTNAANLELLTQRVLVLICLDDVEDGVEPTTESICVEYACYRNPHNRWYDRSRLQIVLPNGVALENGDHTAMDAVVMATVPFELMQVASNGYVASERFRNDARRRTPIEELQRLVRFVEWSVPPSVEAAISRALVAHRAAAQDAMVAVYKYKRFGRNRCRSLKLGADAVVQQALQLAYFWDRGRAAPVYESAMTRAFQHGRTDTIRSLTKAQRAFIDAATRDESTVGGDSAARERRQLSLVTFRAALSEHLTVAAEAAAGNGIDRHLLGLKLALASGSCGSSSLPPLFSDSLVKAASSFELLTSQMVGELFVGGFAHVFPEGYGCCYYIRPEEIAVLVSGNRCEGRTDVHRFMRNLDRAFDYIVSLSSSLLPPGAGPPAPRKASLPGAESKL